MAGEGVAVFVNILERGAEMRMCAAGVNPCGIALCGRVDLRPLEYRGCGHADGHIHVLGDLADVNRVVVRHDRVDDDNDVQLETGSSGDGDRFVVA